MVSMTVAPVEPRVAVAVVRRARRDHDRRRADVVARGCHVRVGFKKLPPAAPSP